MLSTGFVFFALGLSVVAVLFSLASLANARNAVDWVAQSNKRSLSLKKMAEVEAELTDLRDAYDALMASHKKLRARIGMRKVRDDASSALPDPTRDPAGWKAAMRRKLKLSEMNGAD